MYCDSCGTKLIQNKANYCSNCGNKLNTTRQKLTKTNKVLLLSGPIVSILTATVFLITGYSQELKVNEKVIKYQKDAEKAALSGEYQKALKYVEIGLSYRNDYEVLRKEHEVITDIKELSKELNLVKKNIMNEEFAEAEENINLLRKQIIYKDSPLYLNLANQIDQAETSVKIGKIKKEINKLNTLDELSDKLSTLYTLKTEEVSELKKQIYTKMVIVSAAEAEKRLENKHFNDAVSILEEALQYAVNNQKLMSLKERVIAEKSNFEREQLNRIEKAIIAAKEEEKHNLTEAVQLAGVNLTIDKYGDAYINGVVKNTGTETVTSLVIEFIVYGADGKQLERGKTNIFPNQLTPGQTGNFEHVTYSVKEEAKVEIINISWILEKRKDKT